MSYETVHTEHVRTFLLAWSCPFMFDGRRCAGGDYCAFPPGEARLCCAFCPLFESCPDPTGVCRRFLDG